jgi:hypothetical protein
LIAAGVFAAASCAFHVAAAFAAPAGTYAPNSNSIWLHADIALSARARATAIAEVHTPAVCRCIVARNALPSSSHQSGENADACMYFDVSSSWCSGATLTSGTPSRTF